MVVDEVLKVNTQEDTPNMYNLAVEHIKECKACAQRTASHHMGVGAVFEDSQAKDMLDKSETGLDGMNSIVKNANRTFSELQDLVNDLKNIMNAVMIAKDEIATQKKEGIGLGYKIGGAIGAGIVYLMGYFA